MHLRDWMKQNGVTQQELARRLRPPISQAKVSHWLQGSRRVDLHSALQLVEITGGAVTFKDLAELSGHRQARDPAWPHPQGRPCLDVAGPVCVAQDEPRKEAA